jgi:hypothetical protein
MLGFRGPAQPSPTLGDALNAGYLYLEVRCLGCDTHQPVALDVVRRLKTTPIHELGWRRNLLSLSAALQPMVAGAFRSSIKIDISARTLTREALR